jgi:hypothetical protein
MPLSAFDVSTARSVTTYRPFVRNRGAGIQLRENVAHDVVRVMRKPLRCERPRLVVSLDHGDRAESVVAYADECDFQICKGRTLTECLRTFDEDGNDFSGVATLEARCFFEFSS